MSDASPEDVLKFWEEVGPDGWFESSEARDREITERFSRVHARAAAGDLDGWAGTPRGALALIIVLDQFSREIYRNDARAFASDRAARRVAERAIGKGEDRKVAMPLRLFFYMPFEHSERLVDQNRAVSLMHATGDHAYLHYAVIHREAIRRFGRFPHRNPLLGRHTSPAERSYLDGGGFGG